MLSDIGFMTMAVTFAELGDKTQLLAFCLAARFKTRMPIVWGILVATILNHLLAAYVGVSLREWLSPPLLRIIIIVSFVLMAIWMLIPDKLDDVSCDTKPRYGVFLTTTLLFFLAEMGDKTQITTLLLASKIGSVPAVVTGTTLGMLIADVPAVFLGDKLSAKLPLKYLRWGSALIFILFIFI